MTTPPPPFTLKLLSAAGERLQEVLVTHLPGAYFLPAQPRPGEVRPAACEEGEGVRYRCLGPTNKRGVYYYKEG